MQRLQSVIPQSSFPPVAPGDSGGGDVTLTKNVRGGLVFLDDHTSRSGRNEKHLKGAFAKFAAAAVASAAGEQGGGVRKDNRQVSSADTGDGPFVRGGGHHQKPGLLYRKVASGPRRRRPAGRSLSETGRAFASNDRRTMRTPPGRVSRRRKRTSGRQEALLSRMSTARKKNPTGTHPACF